MKPTRIERQSDAGHVNIDYGNWNKTGQHLSHKIKQMVAEGRMSPANAEEVQLRREYVAKHGNKIPKRKRK